MTDDNLNRDAKKQRLNPHDSKSNFVQVTEAEESQGWLLTFAKSSTHKEYYDFYFVHEDGTMFKAKSYASDVIRCGLWYDVNVSSGGVTFKRVFGRHSHAEVRVCAFNIHTTLFPGGEHDVVKLISYVVNGHGYLIVNRQCVGEDIDHLKYTQRMMFSPDTVTTDFTVTNVKNEQELIRSWFSHMESIKPGIYVTYDSSDWDSFKARAAHHRFRMKDDLFACCLDCLSWVKRNLFLPQGSHDLKERDFDLPEDTTDMN